MGEGLKMSPNWDWAEHMSSKHLRAVPTPSSSRLVLRAVSRIAYVSLSVFVCAGGFAVCNNYVTFGVNRRHRQLAQTFEQ